VNYFIIWEIQHDKKKIIFHNIVDDTELSNALNEISKKASGEIRYQQVENPVNPSLAIEDVLYNEVDRMYR
jgi:hypothetical protein